MKVAFDFDDVLVDFVGCWLESVNTRLGLELTREDLVLDGWDMAKHASEIVGMDWLDEWLRKEILFWSNARTTPGTMTTLFNLRRAGFELEVVTNKPDWAEKVVWAWMQRQNPPISKVTIADHYAKHELTDADILVDDRPSTLRAWEQSRHDRLGILFSRSQNKHDRIGLVVAEDMSAVEDIVKAWETQPWR